MMSIDFNNIEPNSSSSGEFELIPENTIARVNLLLEGGDVELPEFGRGNFFKKSQGGGRAKWMPVVFTITGGDYNGRKVWHRIFVDGDKMSERNVPVAKEIGLRTMRSIIESARNINPDDTTPNAQQARQLNSIEDLNNMQLCIKIGIEKGTNGYADRNRLIAPITPNQTGYIGGNNPTPPVTQAQPQQNQVGNNVPDWAK
jgi:hypothetical protein